MTTSSLDEHIGAAQSTLWSFPYNKNIPNVPGYIIRHAVAQLGGTVDLVLIDTNPNMGLLNAYLWWSSDYFLVPCVPDCFTVSALRYLAQRTKAWTTMITELLPQLQSAVIVPLPKEKSEPPQCLGLSLSYIHNDGSNVIARNWRQRLLDTGTELLKPLMQQAFVCEFSHGANNDSKVESLYHTIMKLVSPILDERPLKRVKRE